MGAEVTDKNRTMLKSKNTPAEYDIHHFEFGKSAPGLSEEELRIRRELVNAAVEQFGNDPVKIEQYLNRKNVA
jgi:hypothetical protein